MFLIISSFVLALDSFFFCALIIHSLKPLFHSSCWTGGGPFPFAPAAAASGTGGAGDAVFESEVYGAAASNGGGGGGMSPEQMQAMMAQQQQMMQMMMQQQQQTGGGGGGGGGGFRSFAAVGAVDDT